MNIVILDGELANPGDLSWNKIESLGVLKVYDQTLPDELVQRAKGAEILITNKVVIDADHMDQLPYLRCICLLATGYNNIDVEAASRRKIAVCNAVGYSTESVAQHVFALVLHFTNMVSQHDESIRSGEWEKRQWSFSLKSQVELKDKVLGIYGFGRIGKQVAQIGKAFGMHIIACHTHPKRDAVGGVEFVELDEFFRKSDFLTLHAPLSQANKGIVNLSRLRTMKSSAILINTGRGGLINEADLKEALLKGFIAGAGLDVLNAEPPSPDHPLLGLENCVLTPHNAWASHESRQRLLDIVYENIVAFQKGSPINQVNS